MYSTAHTFHIPVMGTGFSIDTPLKVAKYGINSVISLVDDTLIEQMRKFHSEANNQEYTPITKAVHDYRAKRITAYLNLIDKLVKKQFEELKQSAFETGTEITKYFEMLPDFSNLKKSYLKMLATKNMAIRRSMQNKLREEIAPGSIDVNIMVKLDKDNCSFTGEKLPKEFSDALSAVRGFAKSKLNSAIILSAGFNRKLYSYLETLKEFYTDTKGELQKRIVLKVSDFRSAMTQGKFLARKGLWVSEYRIESGLNCGGHLFPSNGNLIGPILEEFKTQRNNLLNTLKTTYTKALEIKKHLFPKKEINFDLTVQGGIGTNKEKKFLMDYYKVDKTGWCSPFLLVPEVTNVDDITLKKISEASEKDITFSDASPLGVEFSNLTNSLSELARQKRNANGHPGSKCTKGHLCLNNEFGPKGLCTASRQYYSLKEAKGFASEEERELILKKSCICNDLGASVLIKNKINTGPTQTPAICPGPNIAYFSNILTLNQMIDHIYGRTDILKDTKRPNMFIKEIFIHIEYFKKHLAKKISNEIKEFEVFKENLLKSIDYYKKITKQMVFTNIDKNIMTDLLKCEEEIKNL
ncbi:MAG: hypothetical protein PHP69_05340 [Candidatus Omnitrophica bacterium]|nr:hypothetical protein [Candidatus Omnitrophota bacterium]